MADTKVFTARDGALFIQRSQSVDVEYIGCYDLGDLSADEGSIADLIQAFDVNGQYKQLGQTFDPPSAIEFTVTTWLDKVAHYLERVTCPFFLHVNKRCGGVANVINNYERAVVLEVVKRTNRTLSGLVMRSDDTQSDQEFGLVAVPPLLDIYALTPDRQTTAETLASNDIIFVKENLCGDCTPRYEEGMIGMRTNDAGAGTANVEYTLDGGSTWTACAADPFGATEHVMPVTYVWLDGHRIRFIVGRGTTDAGNPAEVAYTDFNINTDTAIGAAWATANVGTTNGQFFFGPKSLFAYDQFNLWGVAGAGYIYKSADAGVTWTAQEAGILVVDDYYVIRFAPGSKLVGAAVGENNAFAKTLDGGVTWSAVTGPSGAAELLTLDMRSDKVWYVGDNAGGLYVTYNAGVSWTTLTARLSGTVAAVRAVMFMNDVLGFVLTNTGGPVGTMHASRDCGRTWQALTTPTNAGLNALDVVRANLVYAVGEAQGGTSMILKTAG